MRPSTPAHPCASICIAVYGCSRLEFVAEFINGHQEGYEEQGLFFTPSQIAGQYAFEQVKLGRKGYDYRRLERCLGILEDAGALFNRDHALASADEFINAYTADFGQDEDGSATFRIQAHSYRLKKYDCHALWARLSCASLSVLGVSRERLGEDEEDEVAEDLFNDALNLRLSCDLIDGLGAKFGKLYQYFSSDSGSLSADKLIDYDLSDYPNFHDESGTTYELMSDLANRNISFSLNAVNHYLQDQGLLSLSNSRI